MGSVRKSQAGRIGGGFNQDGVSHEEASDFFFHLSDLAGHQLEILAKQVLDLVGFAVPQVGLCLQMHAFAHLDELFAISPRRPETAQLSARQAATGLRAERQEAGDQCSIDPVRLGQSAPASPERLCLRRRELPRLNPRRLQARPKTPFAAARRFKANQSIPSDGDLLQVRMATVRVRQTKPRVVGQAMEVKPQSADAMHDPVVGLRQSRRREDNITVEIRKELAS